MKANEPISKVIWEDSRHLTANNYNPNVVLNQELKLLAFSIMQTGWIQPILVSSDFEIIDGFHRWWLAQNNKELIDKYQYQVPICIIDLPVPERMLLTVRINRAKGNHVSAKMHELVSKCHLEYGIPISDIMTQIGAGKDEVDLLLKTGVFDGLNIKQHSYSKAWTVR